MIETIVTLIILGIVVVAIAYILSIWIYKRAPANMCFIRTGFLGTKVCLGQGAIVLPVFHEVTWVSLETIKLIVTRSQNQAILTADKIRVDVNTELYTHVGHTPDDVLTASRTLGEKTFEPEQVRNLLEAKIVSALRSYAATKTLSELHENRDAFAKAIKASVIESFQANGLSLEEVTIVTLEQTAKEHFRADNVFDAEGLKIITEITSAARREVHDTEKRTTVAIKQKDLDTQLELLDIERQEAFARAQQDKEVSNEQALRVGEKQVYVLDQRMSVEQTEIANEKSLEAMRTERDITVIEEHRKRETSEVRKELALEQARRDRDIAIVAKAKEEELANVARKLALEKAEQEREIELVAKAKEHELAQIARDLEREAAEKDKAIELTAKERDLEQAGIERVSAVSAHAEIARNQRHKATEETELAIRARSVETRLSVLELEKQDAIATARQEHEVSNEQAKVLSEKQRFLLESRWQVEQEEIAKALAHESSQIEKAEALERRKVKQSLAVTVEEREREIALIAKELERERADIQRMLAREREERDREIALTEKTRELEEAEIKRLQTTAERERAEHDVESVRVVADAERKKQVDRMIAEAMASARRVEEENNAEIARLHTVTQAEARKTSARQDADAILIRARATSEAQQVEALGVEKEAGAQGRAEAEVSQLKLEAEATGLEAKADALKKYNDAATFLELSKMHIEAERDIQIDQAKAMGNALHGAHIRMYGGENGTVDTIRGLFNSGFGLGEALEGVSQSMPQGLRERFTQNGIRGIFGRPGESGSQFHSAVEQLSQLVEKIMPAPEDREVSFSEATARLEQAVGDDAVAKRALAVLANANENGVFNDSPFENVWSLLQATAKSVD